MSEQQGLKIDEAWASNKPFNFFGPCSAESPDQLRDTAKGIWEQLGSAFIFRAGVWKPRTRPNSFEGAGIAALPWLKEVKDEFGFKISTEVANAQHVEHCLKNEVDVLWIGARTTVSPFAVQEIAEALKGANVSVFVKNPIHADLSLWMGALERINKAGITKLGAIHRGFHMLDSAPYRNLPIWKLAMELKQTFDNLPIVCDASHISGKPTLIPHVVQKSLDLNMDGLMIETHCQPQLALSDAKQQITPKELFDLLTHVEVRQSTTNNQEFVSKMEELRTMIDAIDDKALDLVARRMNLVQEIGNYKKDNKVTIFQVERWRKVLERSTAKGHDLGLSQEFIKSLFDAVHHESIRQQNSVMNPDLKRHKEV